MFLENLLTIGTLVLLEGLLSADNALVLAIQVKHLPPHRRRKALHYGIWGAFLFRFVSILIAAWLIHAWAFKIFGALYLLYIALKHLLRREAFEKETSAVKHAGFWKTVLLVEVTDLIFSLDQILAAVALSPKIWVVYLGGVLGIITMRFVAGGFLKLLDRFPVLERGAYLLVGWIGLKLILMTAQEEIKGFPHLMSPILFWSVMALIFFGSMLWRQKPSHKHKLPEELD